MLSTASGLLLAVLQPLLPQKVCFAVLLLHFSQQHLKLAKTCQLAKLVQLDTSPFPTHFTNQCEYTATASNQVDPDAGRTFLAACT